MRAGHNVKRIRTERGMSQSELGREAKLRQHDICRLEKSERNVVVENWIRMAKALGVTVEELYGDLPSEKYSKILCNAS